MIERPPPRGLNADDTACQRPLAGIQRVGARDLQLVNAVPRPPRTSTMLSRSSSVN